MLKSIRILGTAALAAALLAVLPGAVAARPGFSEVVLEGGLAEPLGDLGDDWETVAGFGAETGYELGLRFRARWPSGWALSPSFHYVRMAKHSGFVEGESLSFFGRGSIFAYGVDAQYFLPARRNRPQFYLSLGAALMHNRYREEYSDGDWFEEGVNTLGLAAGVGLRTGDFEISAFYHVNRFDTLSFWAGVDDYDWDWVSVRFAVALPRMY